MSAFNENNSINIDFGFLTNDGEKKSTKKFFLFTEWCQKFMASLYTAGGEKKLTKNF